MRLLRLGGVVPLSQQGERVGGYSYLAGSHEGDFIQHTRDGAGLQAISSCLCWRAVASEPSKEAARPSPAPSLRPVASQRLQGYAEGWNEGSLGVWPGQI